MIRNTLAVVGLAISSVTAAWAQAPAAPPAAPSPGQSQPAPVAPGVSYDPEGRRDPFVSLLRRGTDPARGNEVRPAGLPGLLISEVTLRGAIASRSGFVGILQGVDGRTYIVREGERLFDGVVRRITADAVVFLQQVDDPLSLAKQREVRKVLRQTEEAQ